MNSRGDKILGVRLAPKGGDNQKIGEIVRGHPLYTHTHIIHMDQVSNDRPGLLGSAS